MSPEEGIQIRQGVKLIYRHFRSPHDEMEVTARSTMHSSEQWGDMVWVDTPGPYPLNAHISNLYFIGGPPVTTVPARPAIPAGRGKRSNVKSYTAWEWIKGYAAWLLVLPIYFSLWAFALAFKRLPAPITAKLLRMHRDYTAAHPMDFRIPPDMTTAAYMHRWWRIPRNAFFNIYYHVVLRSDDDRALHDHPWWNFSIVLDGAYCEHTIDAGGVSKRQWYGAGAVKFRRAGTYAHRLELEQGLLGDETIRDYVRLNRDETLDLMGSADKKVELPVTTIFITGPVLRRWGFHHPDRWVDAYEWDHFMAERGIEGMRMDGGSDAAVSARNTI